MQLSLPQHYEPNPVATSSERLIHGRIFNIEKADVDLSSQEENHEAQVEPNEPALQPRRRKIKKYKDGKHQGNIPTDPSSTTITSLVPHFPSNPRHTNAYRSINPYLSSSTPMSVSRPVRLFIASLGNPPPYQNTRHSAAHTLLKSFAKQLGLLTLQKSKTYGGAGISFGSDVDRPEYTLWQSGSLMNVSGAGVLKAWKRFESQTESDTINTGLVILHDDLESTLGTLKLRRGAESSTKGHNGIKSVQTSFSAAGLLQDLSSSKRFIKIGIGIGRPVSRDRDDVSEYVLGQLTQTENIKIETASQDLEGILLEEIERLVKI